MASCKKVKLSKSEDVEESIFDRFSKSLAYEQLKIVFERLCTTSAGTLGSFTITESNAKFGFGEHGKPFSKADIKATPNTDPQDTIFYFGTVFLKGYKMLKDYLEDPKTIPTGEYMDLILSKLLEYLLGKEKEEFFNNLFFLHIPEDVTEEYADLTVRFAEHFFSKLNIASTYRLDTNCPGKINKCSCCSVDVKNHYGDTSIGNIKVWHGCLDIVLGSSPVAIKMKFKDRSSLPEGKAAEEVEIYGDLENPEFKSQLMAQTIVNSFAQMKKHPECSNFLIPSIGVSKESIVFYFYDCEQDIMLRSREIPFFLQRAPNVINLQAILAAWFVVNYKYLGTGCTDEIKATKKANFFAHAGPLLPIYQNELTVGGIPHNKPLPHNIDRFMPDFSYAKFGKSPEEYLP